MLDYLSTVSKFRLSPVSSNLGVDELYRSASYVSDVACFVRVFAV